MYHIATINTLLLSLINLLISRAYGDPMVHVITRHVDGDLPEDIVDAALTHDTGYHITTAHRVAIICANTPEVEIVGLAQWDTAEGEYREAFVDMRGPNFARKIVRLREALQLAAAGWKAQSFVDSRHVEADAA